MYLSQTSEYALRAMTHLAMVPAGSATRAKDLSVHAGVPVHYLSKIMGVLVKSGLVASEKGHGGGFRLVLPARKIRFIDILAAVGQDPMPNRCAFGWGVCNADQPCALHEAFSQMKKDFQQWAIKTTLADVAGAGGLNQVVRTAAGGRKTPQEP